MSKETSHYKPAGPGWRAVIGLGVITGLLYFASFYPLSQGWLAYPAVALYFVMTTRLTPLKAVVATTLYAVVFTLLLLWWAKIYHPILSLPAIVLYVTGFNLLRLFLLRRVWGIPSRLRFLMLALVYVVIDFLVGNFEHGLPWMVIGVTQWCYPLLLQICDIIGFWGMTAWVVTVGAVLYTVVDGAYRRAGGTRRQKTAAVFKDRSFRLGLLALAAVFAGFTIYGFFRMPRHSHQRLLDTTPERFQISFLQINVDPYENWRTHRNRNIERLITFTQEAALEGSDIIVWSESAFLGYINLHDIPHYQRAYERLDRFRDDGIWPLVNRVRRLSSDVGAHVFIGALWRRASRKHDDHYWNAFQHFRPEGSVSRPYFKMHLVPFGEHLPYEEHLAFLRSLLSPAYLTNFQAGDEDVQFRVDGYRFANVICFEGVFDELVRQKAADGAIMLVNPTNEAWTYRHESLFQHYAFYVFRAIENRMYVGRAANTGVTALIAPNGRTVSQLPLNVPDTLTVTVPASHSDTFFSRHGRLVFYVWGGIVMLVLLFEIGRYFLHRFFRNTSI